MFEYSSRFFMATILRSHHGSQTPSAALYAPTVPQCETPFFSFFSPYPALGVSPALACSQCAACGSFPLQQITTIKMVPRAGIEPARALRLTGF